MKRLEIVGVGAVENVSSKGRMVSCGRTALSILASEWASCGGEDVEGTVTLSATVKPGGAGCPEGVGKLQWSDGITDL